MTLPHFNRLTGLLWQRHCNRRGFNLNEAQSHEWIAGALARHEPSAIGKVGTCELLALEYLDRYIHLPWPRNSSWARPAERLFHTAGVFPVRRDIYQRWAGVYRDAVRELDFVAQWQPPGSFLEAYEQAFLNRDLPKAVRGSFVGLEPVGAPWLRPLAELRWLVVSPFCETIKSQLSKLSVLSVFHGVEPDRLAEAARSCRFVPCPQLPYMVPPVHRDWFEGVEELKKAMTKQEFDVAIIGAGAWSLPLAAHAKRLGKIGLHLGGTLNLLFGIRGGRFDDRGFYNDHWIRPVNSERPSNFNLMENGAYW
ncbi:MAG: hypothetical protein EBU36_04560 [Verrucomicrobia bacterium]|nr:hypothetical protein [Verrucomicrobiota bacterium]